MNKHRIGIIFFNSQKEREHRFQISWVKLLLTPIIALMLCAFIVSGVSKLIFEKEESDTIANLENENEVLEKLLTNFSGKVTEIETKLDYMKSRDDVLRTHTQLPKVDDDTWDVGKGGADRELDLTAASIQPELAESAVETELQLQKFEQKVQLLIESLSQIESRLANDQKLRNHTPSVSPIENGVMTSTFGYRQDPFIQKRKHHNGIDFVAEIGESVQAPSAGIVVFARDKYNAEGTLGKLIILDHGRGLHTKFGHLSKIVVKQGQKVERFQKIGEVGTTGRSTGPHLHYEIWINGRPIDPSEYILN